MGVLYRMATWLGLTRESVMPAALMPPARDASTIMTSRRALAVPAVFRALQVLNTAVIQLTIDVTRNGRPVKTRPSIARRPALGLRLDEWLSQVVLDLATDGNAYLLKIAIDGTVQDLRILPAGAVQVSKDNRTGNITYHHNGIEYPAGDIEHLSLIRLAGWLKGINPIEAARRGLTFAGDAADYAAGWFRNAGQPTGVLTSDQTLTGERALQYRNIWNGLNDDGTPLEQTANPSGIKVLGAGLSYEPIMLKPADVLWLEAQDFTTVDIARIYGTPSTLMLIGIDGAANTYANVSQEWLAFTRFTLMAYLRPIEQAITNALGDGYDARFNVDALNRADTKTRYEAHKLGIEAGWLDPEEVRAIEGLDPRATLPTKPAPKELTQ